MEHLSSLNLGQPFPLIQVGNASENLMRVDQISMLISHNETILKNLSDFTTFPFS